MSLQLSSPQQPRTFGEKYPYWKLYAVLLLLLGLYIWDDTANHKQWREERRVVHERAVKLLEQGEKMTPEQVGDEIEAIATMTADIPHDE